MEYWNDPSKSSSHGKSSSPELEPIGKDVSEVMQIEPAQSLNLLSISSELASNAKQEPLLSGPFAGLIGGSLVTLGTKQILEQSLASLPFSPVARFVIASGAGLVAGGFANNAITGRELLSYKGFANNALFTGMGYAGVRLRGF